MEAVAEAFTTSFQRWAFAAAVTSFVALPFALDTLERPRLEERLRSMPTAAGDFAWIEHAILKEQSDIDVLVLGTSYLWAAVDTPLLEKRLSANLGRPIVARTLGSNFRGEEMYFILLEELLKHRQVGTVILSMPGVRDRRDTPHPYAHRIAGAAFFSMYDGLPARQRASALGEHLLGAPRHALSLLRSERVEASPLVRTNGALVREAGFSGAGFTETMEAPPTHTADELTFGGSDRGRFCFREDLPGPLQLHFIEKTIRLAHGHGAKVVVLNIPTWADRNESASSERERWSDCAIERMKWNEMFPGVQLVGLSARELFGDMGDERAKLFFYSGHMNANGARYFTSAVLPAIEEAVR
jgi:hypothetical protein